MSEESEKKSRYLKHWEFPWQELEVLIGGTSSIDLPEMSVLDWEEATEFIKNYGYDPEIEKDRRLIEAVLIEAMHFIEQHLLAQELGKVSIPEQIWQCDDVRHLILWASGKVDKVGAADASLKLWACSILRVAHTIAHIEGVQRRVAIDVARTQILARFHSHLKTDDEGKLWLGDQKNRVELDSIEWKNDKARPAMILKLLHKKANVAETIFDLLGVRIVTKRLCDVVIVVKFLRLFYMITFANCNPGRARNNLIDMPAFRRNSLMLRKMLKKDRIGTAEFDELIEQLTLPSQRKGLKSNPHSQSAYKSVQLTCRQLIRGVNPVFGWLEKLENAQARHGDTELRGLLDYIMTWPGMANNREFSVFFPFEVQVMDAATYSANQFGDASHDRYRESQLRAARRRVLGRLLLRNA